MVGKTLAHRLALPVLFFPVLFLGLAGPVRAADPPRMLGEILANTEANYQKVHAFTATFRQKTTSAAAGSMSATEAQGRLYYARPRQMRWEYDQPEAQLFVANNQFAWLYVSDGSIVTLFDADKLFASPLARAFFDGALGLKKHFDVVLDPVQSTQDVAVLQLMPRQEDPGVKFAYLWIDLRDYRICRIKTQDIVGNTNEIAIDSFKPQPGVDPGSFHLEIPNSAKVIGIDGRELTRAEIEQLKARISAAK